MSTIVLQALEESLSVGEMKLPAALLTIMEGSPPHSSTHWSATRAMASGSLTSQATA